MKNVRLFILAFALFSSSFLHGQFSVDFYLQYGYNSGINKKNGFSDVIQNPVDLSISQINKSHSFGKGSNYSFGLSLHMLNHFFIDLTIGYLPYSKVEHLFIRNGADQKEEWVSNHLSLFIPLGIQNPIGKLNSRVGIGPLYVPHIEMRNNIVGTDGTDQYVYEKEYIGNGVWGVGFIGSVNYPFSKKINFELGCDVRFINFYPKKSEIKKWVNNGIDIIPSLTVYESVTVYSNDFIISSNSNPDKPKLSRPFAFAFSSIGFYLRLCYRIYD